MPTARRATFMFLLMHGLILSACDEPQVDDEPPATVPDRPLVFSARLDGDTTHELYSVNADGTDLVRLTATDDLDEYAPAWSPDTDRVAFLVESELFVLRVEDGQRTLLAPEVGRGTRGLSAPAWAPDGSRLIYCYPRPPDWADFGDHLVDESTSTTLHIVDADGSNDAEVSQPAGGTLLWPAWSYDGWIAYTSSDDCADCAGGDQLHYMRETGAGYLASWGDRVEHLDWSPDSTQLAYSFRDWPDETGIGVFEAFEDDKTILIENGSTPRWSPDGRRIAFIRDDGIWVMDADGSDDRRILASSDVRGIDW